MRFSTTAVFAVATAMVAAQDISKIPTCAIPCFAAAVSGSGCSISDTKCQCTTGQSKIAEALAQCVPSKCSTEDQAKVAPVAAGICSAAGVSVSVPAAAMPSSAAGARSSGSMMHSGMSSMDMSSMMASGMSSMMMSASSMGSDMMSSMMPTDTGDMSSMMMPSRTGTAPSQVSTAAAANNVLGFGAIAMGFAGVFL